MSTASKVSAYSISPPAATMGPITDSLRAEIGALRKESADQRYFISQKDLSALLTKETITAAILECGIADYSHPAAVNYVLKEGKIVFGILVWRKWEHTLNSFIEHRILDSQLPLAVEQAEKVTQMLGLEFATKAQWDFLPRQLTKEMGGYHCHFRKEEILPFTQKSELGRGSAGDVFKVTVWPSCQTIYPQTSNVVLAVKEFLWSDGRKKYREWEMEALGILRHLQHPNIAPLLASYTHDHRHYLLFPLYKMDLEQFMKQETRPEGFEEDFAFFAALEGLSSALEKVHNLELNPGDHGVKLVRIGYHHDIRPANVLVGKSFYLTDFGLARLRREDEGSKTKWIGGLGDYVGPECLDEKWKHQDVGRPLDIWAFGCMILELASYIHGGTTGVMEFRKNRRGIESRARPHVINCNFYRDGDLRSSVVLWAEMLCRETKSAPLSQLVGLAMGMLKIKPGDRPKASEVRQQLSYLRAKDAFDVAQQEFSRLLKTARQQVDNVASVMAIKLQEGRLSAWGKVLQLTTRNPPMTITAPVSERVDQFRDTLNELLEKLISPTDWSQGSIAEPLSTATAFSISKPLHEELQRLIDRLWAPLPPDLRERVRCVWLADSLAPDDSEALQTIESSTQQEYSDLSQLMSATLEQLRLEFSEFRPTGVESLLPVFDFNDLEIERYFSRYGLGRYCGGRVLIEWVMRLHEWRVLPEIQKGRIRRLAEVLSRRNKLNKPNFCVLDCVGLVVSREGCGFVTAYPSTIPAGIRGIATPISLFEVFGKFQKYDLPLRRRFQLAYQLVSSVWELHTARWLHKNINSKNILFFRDPEESSPEIVLEHPYLVNFRNSSPAGMDWATMEPTAQGTCPILDHSKHPDCSGGSSFKGIYDYYAIGLVLLELGSWSTLDAYIGTEIEYVHDANKFREVVLVKKYAHRLSYAVGKRYQDAVLACLTCDFGQDEEGVLGQFSEKVVEPLRELSEYHI